MNARLIVLNANNGALVNVLATIAVSRYEAMEDESVAVQGLQVQTPVDSFAGTYTFSFGSEPIQVPSFEAWDHFRKLLGLPAQGVSGAFNYRAADKILSARSNGASGTTLRLIEYE